MNILCWLWPLLAGLICGILGYLLGKYLASKWRSKYESSQEDLNACRNEKLKLEEALKKATTNLDDCTKKTVSLEAKLTSETAKISKLESDLKKGGKAPVIDVDLSPWKTKVSNLQADVTKKDGIIANLESKLATALLIPFNADAAKTAFGKSIKQDDLKVVEGIGVKIEELFHKFGIKTWKQLGETSVDKCQEVLDSGGERFKMHKPTTWPKQAQMAYEGKWTELVKWQDELDGGK